MTQADNDNNEKFIILYFIQIRHTDDFPSTGGPGILGSKERRTDVHYPETNNIIVSSDQSTLLQNTSNDLDVIKLQLQLVASALYQVGKHSFFCSKSQILK